jgi:hypothetical protein
MLCIHHNDADGHASAAIVYHRYPECRFVEADYREFPIGVINKDELTIIVDYSPEPFSLWPDVLAASGGRLIWIDHHITSIQNAEQYPDATRLPGLRTEARCGAYLSWLFFFEGLPIPYWLKLVDQWDRHVFTDRTKDEVLNFVRGLETDEYGPTDPIWKSIISQDTNVMSQICYDGTVVRRYETKEAVKNLDNGYEIKWEGHRCLVCNCTMAGSRLFDVERETNGRMRPGYDIFICWAFDGEDYTVHLYSDPSRLTVNDLAQKYHGGGHPGSAGFVTKHLPWEQT